jgi:hypothetical protein
MARKQSAADSSPEHGTGRHRALPAAGIALEKAPALQNAIARVPTLGAREGDVVVLRTPAGVEEVEVVEIRYEALP